MKKICATFTIINRRPVLFLDRDGVLIEDFQYVNTREATKLVPGIVEAISMARISGFLIFVVTNQAGIARGYFTEEECINFNQWLMDEFTSKGAPIDQLVYCPSHPNFGLKKNCGCRKPGHGMLEYLSERWNVDLKNSLMLGDKESDMLAGNNFGISSILIDSKSNIPNLVKNHIESCQKNAASEKIHVYE